MFTYEGQVNDEYVDTNKDWFKRRKFIDQYVGIRLINDNTNKKWPFVFCETLSTVTPTDNGQKNHPRMQ